MARSNRQRAKERQARRKAQGGDSAIPQRPEGAPPEDAPAEPPIDSGNGREERLEAVDLQVGAPPEDVGRSDEVLEYEQDVDAVEDDGEEHFDESEDQPEEDLVPGTREHRRDPAEHKNRPRLVQFMIAVWAELQRVQWPDRQALTTLTGVVLGFVLIAGGYLGLLDAIASRLIQAIL